MLDKQLQAALDRRRQRGTLRSLTKYPTISHAVASPSESASLPSPTAKGKEALIDFSSNDYMGLGHSNEMRTALIRNLQDSSRYPLGSTGSRLLDGNSIEHEQLETRIAAQFGGPTALLFNSGFDANASLLSTLPQPGDFILYDELVHASAHDGMRASRTSPDRRIAFAHNDLHDLVKILESINQEASSSTSNVFVVVEAVYSMDGDLCPLKALIACIDEHLPKERRCIVVDEAHAVGVYGDNGAGLVAELGLNNSVDIRLSTFGKALGCSGAAVLCSPLVRHFLINYARPLIYSTAIPHTTLLSIHCALDILGTAHGQLRSSKTLSLARLFRNGVRELIGRRTNEGSFDPGIALPSTQQSGDDDDLADSGDSVDSTSTSPIVPLLSSKPRLLAQHLIQNGYLVRAICYPTVPKGAERIRICFHSHNEEYQVLGLLEKVEEWCSRRTEESVAPQLETELRSKL